MPKYCRIGRLRRRPMRHSSFKTERDMPQEKKSSPAAKVGRTSAKKAPGQRRSAGLLGESVYDALMNDIRRGTLSSGDRLVEVEIGERLEVSRTPVREALQRLTSQGMAEFAGARGLVVATLSAERVSDLYAMREVLEGAAARFAALHASDFERASLQALVKRFAEATSPGEAARVDRQIDETIWRAARNQYLLPAIHQIYDYIALLGPTTYSVPGRIEAGARESHAIVEAIIRRDPDGAEDAARQHIRAICSLRLSQLLEARM
jgi:DNA-binding GntR family transcriptional regulator